jgi:hypothetical protein
LLLKPAAPELSIAGTSEGSLISGSDAADARSRIGASCAHPLAAPLWPQKTAWMRAERRHYERAFSY